MTRHLPPPIPLPQVMLVVMLCLLTGCASPAESLSPPAASTVSPPTLAPTPAPTLTPSPAEPNTCNENWQAFPVIPIVSEAARELYQQGITAGNDPHAFSKIGDGEISTSWFLTDFDLGGEHYNLGSYQRLEITIQNFQGSFARQGLAAQRGFNTNRILDPAQADPAFCNAGESPLECELRLHKPSFAILSLGTNQVHRIEEFEAGMRQILQILLSKQVLPILSTKGDNLEGDHRLNRTIACLAQEYQIPLWNFWAAIQSLPAHGLQPDLEHLTYHGVNDFTDYFAMQSAWTVRNLTALQTLDAVWTGVSK